MNTLYVVSRLLKGDGPVNQALNLALGLRRLKVNMIVVTLFPEDPSKPSIGHYRDNGVTVIELNRKPWQMKEIVDDLRILIKQYNINIFQTYSLFPDMAGYFLRKEVNVITIQRSEFPFLWERRGYIPRIIAGYVDKFIASKENVVACSQSLGEIIRTKYKINCSYIRNGVDIDIYKPICKDEKLRLRKQLSIPIDKKIFIVVGSLIGRKNVRYIIDCVLKLQNSQFLFLILGTGQQKDELEALCENYENIRFLGQQKTPLYYYQCADFYVSASLTEGFPNTVLESLACGVPVLLSDIPQHREFFEYGNVGALFSLSDKRSLEDVLLKCQQWNYDDYSARCLKVAINELSKYKMAEHYLEYYRKLL